MRLWTGDIVLKCRARGDSVDLNQSESHIWLQLFGTRSGLLEVDKIAEIQSSIMDNLWTAGKVPCSSASGDINVRHSRLPTNAGSGLLDLWFLQLPMRTGMKLAS